ncbi:MAG TPA: ABC transporter permease [Blastocatellia bacterium]|nr:ABC transporter permease [Blastocatellia bacterium]
MRYFTEIRLAISNLHAHKLRTFLTMLGMIFGVGAVIAMLSIGAGAEKESLALIDTMGLRNIIIRDREFKEEDLKKIRENSLGLSMRDVQAIQAVAPDIESYSARKRVKPFQIFSFKGKSDDSNVIGVTPSYFRAAKYDLAEGSFLAEPDERDFEQFCVIGSRVRQKLFGYQSPVGRQIKIDKLWFTVIGVLADNALAKNEFEGVRIQDFSNDIFIPLATALKKFEPRRFEAELDEVVITLKNTEAIKSSALLISQVLANTHGKENDYSLIVPRELLEQNQRTQRIFNIVMSAIASISLLVGGIGIMNIMLANILERTREIGVRRAIGARRRDIWQQFLVEALTISLIGGLTGILFGFGVSRVVALYAQWSTVVTGASIALSFGVAAATGLIFGIYPAVRASRLDPVEALRYE